MSKVFTRTITLLFAYSIFFLSCKKDDVQKSSGGSSAYTLLISATQHFSGCTDSTQILYDDAGRISSTLRFNSCTGTAAQPLISRKWFAYDAGRLFILDTSFMADKDTLTLDATLHILEMQRFSPSSGSVSFFGKYTYTPEGLLQASTMHYSTGGGYDDSTRYTFSEGNLVEAASGSDTLYYTYYEDKQAPAFAVIIQNGLSYGSAFLFKNANLVKEAKNQHGIVLANYSYDFDGYGNVVRKLTFNGGVAGGVDTTTYRYAYVVD